MVHQNTQSQTNKAASLNTNHLIRWHLKKWAATQYHNFNKPQITWTKDGTLVETTTNSGYEKSSSAPDHYLTIVSPKTADAGMIRIEVVGERQKNIQ